MVMYDSLNRHMLETYGCDWTITPNFRRLAERSVQFENCYVGSMPCMPARRELQTGRMNFYHRSWGPMEPFDDSMPELLKENGVYTHLISDHLHYWEDGGSNYHTRYSSWEIIRGQEGDHWKGQKADPEIPPVVKVPQKQQGGGTSGLWRYDWVNRQHIKEEADFPQTKCFDRACEFLKVNHGEDNWMLHLETFDPHEPFYAPQKYLDMYPETYEGKHFDWPRGAAEETTEEIAHCRRQYQALVTMCDHNLGRILDLMDQYGMWEDTMLIVGTDHGFLLAEHGYWGKNQMPYYNEVAHTPLFIWDPRFGEQDVIRRSLVQMIDWMPTLLHFFGTPIPEDVQGNILDGVIQRDEPNREYALYGVFSGHVNITDGDYAYMRAPLPEKVDEIYNYTLEPRHMNSRFSPKEMRTAVLVPPFSFTKGCPVLKIKSKDKYKVGRFGTRLYDLKEDPEEKTPIQNEEVENRMIRAMIRAMKDNDCPQEQFERLGLNV